MTTPRIEEMVNGYTKEAMLFKVGEGEMERHQRLQNYVVEALTQAHQAGIDVGKTQALHLLEDLFSKAKDKAELIEMFNDALQDNK